MSSLFSRKNTGGTSPVKSYITRTLWDCSLLTLSHLINNQKLKRIAGPEIVITNTGAFEQYSATTGSSLTLLYGLALNCMHRLVSPPGPRQVLELASGPGVFSTMLAEHLKPKRLVGLELSEQMLRTSKELAAKKNSFHTVCDFFQQDVRDLSRFNDNSFDLVCFMDAAHHMPHTSDVSRVLKEADRVCDPHGIVFMMDPVRPKTSGMVERYYRFVDAINTVVFEAHSLGFKPSLNASFTAREFIQTIPRSVNRRWVHITTYGFKPAQIVIGLPVDRQELFLRPGLTDTEIQKIIPSQFMAQWHVLKLLFRFSLHKEFGGIWANGQVSEYSKIVQLSGKNNTFLPE